jgi:hypothetical protein
MQKELDYTLKLEEKEEDAVTYKFPTVITGGKEPPDGTIIGENWLLGIPERSVFAAIDKNNKGFNANEFHIVKKGKRAVLLLVNIQEPEVHFWCDSVKFSRQMELLEILLDGNTIMKAEELDEQSNRTDQEGTLDNTIDA